MDELERANPYAAPSDVENASPLHEVHDFGSRLAMTSLGLKTIFTGMMTLFITIALGIGLWTTVAVFAAGGQVVFWLLMIGFGIAVLLLAVGPLLCLTVPVETHARPWILAVVIPGSLAVVGNVLPNFFMGTIFFSIAIAAILLIVAAICFLIFLLKLARSIGRTDLAETGKSTAIIMVASLSLLLTILVAMEFLADGTFFRFSRIIWLLEGGVMVFVLYRITKLVADLANATRPR